MDMVDKVARAMFPLVPNCRRRAFEDHPMRDDLLVKARAAIEAMREPELMMVQAACDATFGPVPLSPEAAHMIGWRAMISAALKGEAE